MESSVYIDEYTHFLAGERHKSRNTIDSYKRDITQYITYLEEHDNMDITAATQATVTAYLDALRSCGKAASTVSRALASLKSFYSFIMRSGIIKENPTTALEAPKPEKKLPHILSSDEVERLLAAPILDDYKGIRDKAMLELLYATGIRVSELINLNLNDVNIPMSFIRCRGVRKERIIPMGHTAAEAIDSYIDNARLHLVRSPGETALFVNIAGVRLSRQGFWKIIKHYGKEAKIHSDITPHTLRHSFAAHLVRNGADLESIKEMMGHADIASTQIYSMLPDEHLRDVYSKTHPRA
ncbi:MAG: site-specific tyrosine recombinase XerD [bacterium]|nr:site-specific tyrosine recombinase XerD [bacterium]